MKELYEILLKALQVEQVAPMMALPVQPLFVVNVLLNESVFNNSDCLTSRSIDGGKEVRFCSQGIFPFVLLQSLLSY